MSGMAKKSADDFKVAIEQGLPGKFEACSVTAPRRVFVTVRSEHMVEAGRFLHDQLGITHVSTITGRDTGTALEILYHLAKDGTVITVREPAARDNAVVPSLIGIFPGATLYEREIHDILGVHFEGHGDMRPLVLPDDWPAGVYPLRKDFTYNQEDGVLKK
jgi:NADH:ubiquinone oxidoreductase subunit C